MTTAEILLKAADLIEPEGAWTQGWWARDAEGRAIPANWRGACCWCVDGAIQRVTGSDEKAYRRVDEFLYERLGDTIRYGDTPGRTQQECVQALRDAAKAAPVNVARGVA